MIIEIPSIRSSTREYIQALPDRLPGDALLPEQQYTLVMRNQATAFEAYASQAKITAPEVIYGGVAFKLWLLDEEGEAAYPVDGSLKSGIWRPGRAFQATDRLWELSIDEGFFLPAEASIGDAEFGGRVLKLIGYPEDFSDVPEGRAR